MEKNSERELLPDVLRGFAIILVVLGHCIQEGSGEVYKAGQSYFNDRLYQFIYSFHMPLFMLISGYLSWKSISKAVEKQERKALFFRRVSSLLSPIFLWTAFDYARILISNYIENRPQPEALVFVYFYNALNNLWFLWAVWWCFFAVYVVHYFFKDSVVIYGCVFILMFVLPDGLGLGAYKYMMPYFIAGYYAHGYMKHSEKMLDKIPKYLCIIICGLAFAVLFAYYNEDSFIYLTGYKLIGKDVLRQLTIDLYRMIIGFAGSCFFILVFQSIIGNNNNIFDFCLKLLKKLGANSMGIYILSGYLLVFIIGRISFDYHPSYMLNVIEMIAVIAVSLPLTMFLEKIPVLKKLIGK